MFSFECIAFFFLRGRRDCLFPSVGVSNSPSHSASFFLRCDGGAFSVKGFGVREHAFDPTFPAEPALESGETPAEGVPPVRPHGS